MHRISREWQKSASSCKVDTYPPKSLGFWLLGGGGAVLVLPTKMTLLRTLFLNPPSFENFDGGAGSRWPATREIESYWYPVWLAYPAGMLEGARLLDAPSHKVSAEETVKITKD